MKAKLIGAAKITCKLGFVFYLLNFSTIDNVLGHALKSHATEEQLRIARKIRNEAFERINPLMKINKKALQGASNRVFSEEILKKEENGEIRYGEIEAAANKCDISTRKACELCGIKYQDTPSEFADAVAKRDFWRRYGREKTRSWISNVKISNLLGVLVVEFPNEFAKDYQY